MPARHQKFGVSQLAPAAATLALGRVLTSRAESLERQAHRTLISAIIEFERGGRLQCELTDVRGPLQVGDEVIPAFRRGATIGGIHNYQWKARPVYRTSSADPEPAAAVRKN